MGLETRKGGKRKFFYRSTRKNGKTVKTYLGPVDDLRVQYVWRTQRYDKAQDKATDQERAGEMGQMKKCDVTLDALNVAARRLARLPPELQDCCRTTSREFPAELDAERKILQNTMYVSMIPAEKELDDLVRAAEAGDSDALAQLEALTGATADLFSSTADLGSIARRQMVEAIAGAAAGPSHERVNQHLDRFVDDVGVRDPDDQLERMLIDVVVLNWLTVVYASVAQAGCADRRGENKFWDAMFARAVKRHADRTKDLVGYREARTRAETAASTAG